ncbi:MAG: hypothetical protein OEP52_09890 [Acidimicrobiia bacterium]|nr:hypothetical protein [Acidimicrobiia bacterium]
MKRLFAVLAGLVLAVAACGGDGTSESTVAPVLDDYAAATFVAGIDNTYFPFTPGASWSYEGIEDGEVERIEVVVTDDTRVVDGVTTIVVRDTVTLDGELIEDTFDWYAQDSAGNVWYMGEDSREYDNGEVKSTAGSWETGVDGALPGIIMYADPAGHLNVPYRQEFYAGEAEDVGEVVQVGATVAVGGTTYTDVVVIREWNLLEPGVFENKYFAPGIGVILEEVVEGGSGRVELLATSLP